MTAPRRASPRKLTLFLLNMTISILGGTFPLQEGCMLMTIRSRVAGAMAATALAALAATNATAEDGVSAATIVFGQAAVPEGPPSALGQGMRTGIQAAFAETNKKGRIHARTHKP